MVAHTFSLSGQDRLFWEVNDTDRESPTTASGSVAVVPQQTNDKQINHLLLTALLLYVLIEYSYSPIGLFVLLFFFIFCGSFSFIHP